MSLPLQKKGHKRDNSLEGIQGLLKKYTEDFKKGIYRIKAKNNNTKTNYRECQVCISYSWFYVFKDGNKVSLYFCILYAKVFVQQETREGIQGKNIVVISSFARSEGILTDAHTKEEITTIYFLYPFALHRKKTEHMDTNSFIFLFCS